MQNKLLSIDAELEKDQFKGLEMRELNDRKCTSQVLCFFSQGLQAKGLKFCMDMLEYLSTPRNILSTPIATVLKH